MNKISAFFMGLKQGFRDFSHLITNIVNFILLSIVYFIGVGIVSLTAKLVGKHFIDLKNSGSSWVQRKLKKRPIEEYHRMF